MTDKQQWVDRVTGNSSGNRFFLWVIKHMGLYTAYFFLLFASVQYALFDKKSKLAIRELRSRLGLKTTFFDYIKHFHSFGESIIDRVYYLSFGINPYRIENEDSEFLYEEIKNGRGAILLGAHFGNWALAGSLLKGQINVTVNLAMYSTEKDMLKMRSKKEESSNVNVISINPDNPGYMIEILKALRKGEIVCFLGDRILGDQRCEKLEFLGKEACFPSGPFLLASVSEAPVIPFFATKHNSKSYRVKIFKPISVKSKDSTEIRKAVSAYVSYLEEIVKKNPYQWYNFYPFWRENNIPS